MTRIPRIFVVDDDPMVLKALCGSLSVLSCRVRTFSDPRECLIELQSNRCDLLISDLSMPEMDGLELLRQIRQHCPRLDVLMVSGYGDIPIAVQALKEGAIDFIEKPLDETTLIPIVRGILEKQERCETLEGMSITDAERDVLRLIADGKTNREIAQDISRSVRTVENHRYRLMRKLKVSSTAELVKFAIKLGME